MSTCRKISRLKMAVMMSFAILLSAPVVTSAESQKEVRDATVSVSAECSVKIVPDIAEISLSITDTGETAAAVQEQNTQKLNAVLEALKQMGVDENCIRTSGYNIYPNYDYQEYQKITGYTVTVFLKISGQKIEDTGKIINVCVSQGINGIDGISYSCSGYQEAYQEALTKAVEEARATAETIAAASGKSLGDVIEVTEGYQDTTYRYDDALDAKRTGEAAEEYLMDAGTDVPMMPGEAVITASVTASWHMDE